jgi:hypothetical protein
LPAAARSSSPCGAQRCLRGVGPRTSGLGEPFGRHHGRARFIAQLRQRVLRRRLRLLPQGADHLAGGALQLLREIGMLNANAALLAQGFPKPGQRLGRRAHAALAHQLVQLVGGGGQPIAEEQQHAHLAVQILRLGMLRAQGLDFGLHPGFGDG